MFRQWRHCFCYLREGGGGGQDQVQEGGRRQARVREVDRGRQHQGSQGPVQHPRGKIFSNLSISNVVFVLPEVSALCTSQTKYLDPRYIQENRQKYFKVY